jgi:hypothetical protein
MAGLVSEMAVFHRAEACRLWCLSTTSAPTVGGRFADAVFAVSEELRAMLVAYGVSPKRVFVVPSRLTPRHAAAFAGIG